MNVRPLFESDIAFLTSACGDFPDAWNEEMLLSAFRAGNFYGFIAEETENGKTFSVGFITYSMNIDTADLQDLYVREDFRKGGVGYALLLNFIDDAKKRGAEKLFLEVRESNLPAIRLYEKAGFTFLSVRRKYYSDGENAVVLIKEL